MPAFAADLPAERSKAFFELWKKGDYQAMYEQIEDSWRAKWPFEQLTALLAPIKPVKLVRQASSQNSFNAQFYDAAFVYKWDVYYADDGKIAGMSVRTEGATVDYPAKHDKDAIPRPLRFPFAAGDEWLATGTHHKVARSQRFALDLRIMRDGATYKGSRADAAAYFAYGKTVLSPAAGTIVEASDGEPDAPIAEPAVTDGNHVLLKVSDAEYVYLCHFKPGSVLVKEGDRVKAGQPLAQVGTSGHSTEPHLHIEAFDSLPRRTADAWPITFKDVIHNGAAKDQARVDYEDSVGAQK